MERAGRTSPGSHRGRAVQKRVVVGACALAAALLAGVCAAQDDDGGREHAKGTTSRAARDNAVASIPFDKLAPEGRQKVQWVLNNTSVFRRLPTRVIQCDPDFYLFLVEHPDVVVDIWQTLGVSHLEVRQSPANANAYRVTDDIGTAGGMEFLYRSPDTHVLFVDGTYSGPLFGHKVRGRGIMVLKSGYVRQSDGRSFVTSRLDAFMNVEPDTAEFLTKTFQPMVGKIADGNFLQTVGFVACLSRTAEVNNAGMQRLANKLTKIDPEVRKRFGQLAQQTSDRAAGASTADAPPPLADPDAPRLATRPESETR